MMRFGVVLPTYGTIASTDAIREVVILAEELGYDSVWTTDHILVPQKYRRLFGNTYELMTTLAFAAGITNSVKLGTSLMVAPLRHPALIAKEVATIDSLSNGRMILAMGAGYMEEEFSYLGADFVNRGNIFDEEVTLMRSIWSQDVINHEGRFFAVKDAVSYPKPFQSEGPPIWIGGVSNSAIKRAATLGDGWHPNGGISPGEFEKGVGKLRAWSKGRNLVLSLRQSVSIAFRPREDPASDEGRFAITGTARNVMDSIGQYKESGLEHLVCEFEELEDAEMGTKASLLRSVEVFAREIIPSFR